MLGIQWGDEGKGRVVDLLARDYAGVVQLAQLLTAGLSDTERTAVFSSTAARLYGIGVPRPGVDGDQMSGDGSWL